MPEITKTFAYHKPSEASLARITELRELFTHVDRKLKELCGPGRELSIAITNNEQTAMWAVKAVVFNDPTSVADTKNA